MVGKSTGCLEKSGFNSWFYHFWAVWFSIIRASVSSSVNEDANSTLCGSIGGKFNWINDVKPSTCATEFRKCVTHLGCSFPHLAGHPWSSCPPPLARSRAAASLQLAWQAVSRLLLWVHQTQSVSTKHSLSPWVLRFQPFPEHYIWS